jgi:hypothetical protein
LRFFASFFSPSAMAAQGEFMKGNQGEKGVASEARGATDWPVLLPVTGSKDCAALIELAARLVFGRLRVRLGQSSAFRLLAWSAAGVGRPKIVN